MFGQGEERTGLQNTKRFTEKLCAVGDVHGDMLRVAAIESAIVVGQALSVTNFDGDFVLHLRECGQPVARLDKGCRDVKSADAAVKTLGQIAGRPAEAASNVDKVVAGFYRQGICQFHGRRKSTGMEMIDRCQLLHGYGLRVDRGSLHRCKDPCIDVALAPMIRD